MESTGLKSLKNLWAPGFRRRHFGLGAAGWLAAAHWPASAQGAVAGQQPPPSAAELFDTPYFDGAVLSPDGRKVAYRLRLQHGRPSLMVTDLDSMQTQAVVGADEVGIGDIEWVNDDRLVFNLAAWTLAGNDRHVNPGLFAVNADGSKLRQLIEAQRSWLRWADSPKMLPQWASLLQVNAQRNAKHVWALVPEAWGKKEGVDFIRLHQLDTLTGRSEELELPLHAQHWLLDAHDTVRALLTREGGELLLKWRDGADKPWRTLTRFDPLLRTVVPRRVDADGTLWVSSGDRSDTLGVFAWDFERGEVSSRALASSPDYDLSPGFIERDGKLLGLRVHTDAAVTHWLDEGMRSLQASFDKALPNAVNQLSVAQRGASPWVLVNSHSDTQPGSCLVFNRDTRKPTRLGDVMPALKGKAFGGTELLKVQARDGLSIPCWLTLPPSGPRKNLPLVVLVHGGPWVRGGSWEWRADVQFLASRGYAVLQPEFRGSVGFGSRHFRAGWKQWGQAMQDDVTDATRWVIEQGTAHAQRVAIMGASYGGYATLMGLVREPALYRCGVQWVGVTDPALLFDAVWSDFSEAAKTYTLARMVGDPQADAALLARVSPLKQARHIKAPLLMAYGARDRRVPQVHGERLRDALQAAGHTGLEWVEYPQEAHGWVDLKTQVDFWGRVEKFLARHLAPLG